MSSAQMISGAVKHLRSLSRGRSTLSFRPFSSEAGLLPSSLLSNEVVSEHSPIYSGSASATVADVCAKVSPVVVQIHVPRGVYDNMGTMKRVGTRTVAAPTRVQNSHVWMRACTTVAGPAPVSVKTSVAAPSTSDGCLASDLKAKKKKIMFEELMDVSEFGGAVEDTLNAFTTKEEEYGVSITKADLVSWSILIDRYGRPEISVQIFEWMDKKKMKFSPSQLAHYVDFIDRVHGIRAALDYFESVDPDFDNMDYEAKNWPAYDFLARSMSRNWNKRPWF